ncbi:AAA family ATPase [Pseudomonas sp. MIS38]|uniref:AAA family ATPase n=1 Tax=Pseudomonas sp. MIS38 TaxID=91465 RepID=UPI001CA6A979|nr:AAA family ATPase [Pseudomonas sp. MIS38]MBY8960844.1 AAA family ATPase [Pseudomonas sp. MIS38]
MDVQAEIRTWLLKQSDWLQEAADRLLKKGELTPADITDLVAILKTPAGQKPTAHRGFGELTNNSSLGDELRLVRIAEVVGIENLEPRVPLEFGSANLTVIYGHNGSGKSSYTRILKKVSGKPRAVDLKTNVFKSAPAHSKCSITSQLNGVESLHEWSADGDAVDALRGIDIFDSDEASHYLTAESAATYIPPVIGLFEKLASSVELIRQTLESEQDKLVSALPELPPIYGATPSKTLYSELGKLSQAEIETTLRWAIEDERRLLELVERLKTEDPSALAQQKRRTKTELQKIISALQQASTAFGVDNIHALRVLRQDAVSKRQIAVEGAKVKSAALEGVGTATWRAMWEAARLYSATPYPETAFPVTAGARCVLCHQELSEDAQKRLKDFEFFVHSKLELDAKTAEAKYQADLDQLPSIIAEQDMQTQCQAAGITDEAWLNYLKGFWQQALSVKNALFAHEVDQSATPVHAVSESIIKLTVYRDELEATAAQYEQDALNFDRVQASNQKLALEAKKWITEQAGAVGIEVDRLRKVKDYESWKGLAGTRAISMKSAEVTQAVVTEAYVERFNRELLSLGATRIQVELVKTRTRNAKVLHQLKLKGAQNGRAMPDSVLSDGERRIISLAAFLADVCDKPGAAPFLFDDPISSLDHDFEWFVACRLVELAKNRQVIVLTHRLSLYGILEDLARKEGEKWKTEHHQPMCIEAYAGVAGHPADQDVWNANTKKANNLLITKLDAARKAGEAGGAAAYRMLAQGICSEFRKLIERSVEEDLLNKIVLRHRRSITTDNRLHAIQGIEPEDCKLIDTLMTKYSCYEHSQSSEIPIFIPEELELRQDLEALKGWREGLTKRRAVAA